MQKKNCSLYSGIGPTGSRCISGVLARVCRAPVRVGAHRKDQGYTADLRTQTTG